jgi:hypothetical protein
MLRWKDSLMQYVFQHWLECFDQWLVGVVNTLLEKYMLPAPEDFKVEAPASKLREKPTKAGWTIESHSITQRTGLGQVVTRVESRGPTQTNPWTGSVHIKSFEYCQERFCTRSASFLNEEEIEILKPHAQKGDRTYLRHILYMSQSKNREEKRHKDRINNSEITYGTPRLEHFLKGAVENYAASINRSINEYLQAGNTLPYDYVQVEYGIMKGFVPEEAFVNTAPPEEISKLRVVDNPNNPGQKGVEAAYISLYKILKLTPETLDRKRREIAAGAKQNPADSFEEGTHRVTLYQAMVPLTTETNFPKARYRLLEDILYHLTAYGMEYQERRNIEENEKIQQMQRQDVQAKVREVEDLFTVSKGGLNAEVNA